MVIRTLLDDKGLVARARILKGVDLGPDRATLATGWTWQFEPARLNGSPVPVVYNLIVSFNLDSMLYAFRSDY